MHSDNKGIRTNNHLINDHLLQQITILALMSNPSIDKRLEQTILLIDGIANTVRTLRRGMEFFNNSMREAQKHMLSLPNGAAYQHYPYQNKNKLADNIFNGVNTKPIKEEKHGEEQ